MAKQPLDFIEHEGQLYIRRFIPHPKKPGSFKTTWSHADDDQEYQEAKNRALQTANIFIKDLEKRGSL